MISSEYKKILQREHRRASFGKRAKIPPHLFEFIVDHNPQTILDFGCGKGKLVETLKDRFPDKIITGYDPANPEFDHPIDNKVYDLIYSSDVLEHVEPVFIDQTLAYLSTKSKYIYHLIALSPAKLILADGRNAHLIQETTEWWKQKFINNGYTILKEDYSESIKYKTSMVAPMLVKKYFIMAKNDFS
jgi:cyclopropane fatty-acyl-phospholipid synthase-like methyltransferase